LQSRTPDDPVDIPHDIENRAADRRRAWRARDIL